MVIILKKRYIISGIIFSWVLGVILHFFFDWFGGSSFIGLFSAVNESVWEHLKLLFYPVLIFSIYEYFLYGKNIPSFIPSRTLGTFIALFFIVSAYYTYSGIIGKHYAFVDIALFFIAVVIVFVFTAIAVKNKPTVTKLSVSLSIISIVIFVILLSVWTFNPPHINLFRDVPSGTYGIFRSL